MPYKRDWNETCPRIWSEWESEGNKWVVQDLDPKDIGLAIDLLLHEFIEDEKMCSTLDLKKDPASVRGLRHYWETNFAKRVSLACYCEQNGAKELVAYNCCYVASIDDGDANDDREIEGTATQNVLKGMQYTESKVDIFNKYYVDSYLGGAGLFVRRKYRGRHLGERLLNARELLCRHLGIKLTVTVFTGPASQKCAARCGFETIAEATLGELGRVGLAYSKDDTAVLKLMAKYYG